jgi:glycosyltransferase involved in cell wall biosynthesis
MIAGNNQSYYGQPPENAETWRQIEEEKGGYDPSRVHFVGWLSRTRFLSLLRISGVHVYLTIPYVLSWSMVQAMSAGCCLVGSASPPVEEVVQDGINGLLVDYQSPSEIAERIEEALSDASLRRELGNAARETILERYRLEDCLQKQMDLLFGKKTG